MNEAEELIRIVEARGGRLTIEGAKLVIEPKEAALPVADALRAYKPEIVALLQSRAEETESAPADPLPGEWLLERCVYRDHAWGGIGGLFLDLARWCVEHGQPAPESRRALTAELEAEGFAVTTDGLVYGLMLAEDLQAHERFQAMPEASETPAVRKVAKGRNAGGRCA